MKKLLPVLFLVINLPAFSKEVTIPKNPDGGWYFKTLSPVITAIQPGDVIIVTSDIAYGYIYGLNGTKENPIIIKAKGGRWRFGTNGNYALILENCHHFIIDGSGDELNRYGLIFGGKTAGAYLSQTLSLGLSDNYEIKNVEVTHGEVGMFSNYSTGGKLQNIKIHDNWIHDMRTPGTTCEGMYFGNTSNNSILQSGFVNIEIYNNIFEDLGGDALQLCCAENFKIYGNTVRKYGVQNLIYQQTGILIGGNSFNGVVENNAVENGTGTAIQYLGCGYVKIYRNSLLNTSTAVNQDAVYISKRGIDGPMLQADVIENIIVGANRNGIRNENGSNVAKPGKWERNQVSGTGATKYLTQLDVIADGTLPPVIVSPAATVTKAYHDSIVSEMNKTYQVAVDLLNTTKASLLAANAKIIELAAYKERTEAFKKEFANFFLLQ